MVGQMDYTLASSGEGVCPLRVEGCEGGAGRLINAFGCSIAISPLLPVNVAQRLSNDISLPP